MSSAYIRNKGTSGKNLALFSGRPMDFQATQYIDITLPNTPNIYLIQSFNNTVATADLSGRGGQTYSIGKTDGNGALLDGLFDFFILRSVDYTPEEIALSNSNPNAFYEAMKNDASTLFCMDFRGIGAYIPDNKNNVVTDETDTEKIDISNSIFQLSFIRGTKTFINNEVVLSGSTSNDFRFGVIYHSDYTTLPDNTIVYRKIKARSSLGTAYINANGKNNIISTSSTTIEYWTTTSSGTAGYDSYFAMLDEDLIIESIENIYCSAVCPIINYSPTQRTNFTQEPTGLQDLTRSFDSLGFYTGVTDYLNCNGVGKATITDNPRTSNITINVNPTVLGGNILSDGVVLDTTGLVAGSDNEIILNNQAVTGDINIGIGYKGKVTIYKEDLA